MMKNTNLQFLSKLDQTLDLGGKFKLRPSQFVNSEMLTKWAQMLSNEFKWRQIDTN